MRNFRIFGIIFLIFFVGACVNPPDNFPSVPQITFQSLEYVEKQGPDSLIVQIGFQDAEGDLGLNATETNPPFNAFDYVRNAAGELITYSDRPSEAPSYNPIDWIIDPVVNNQVLKDTVWVEQNENQYNIFVKFFIKRNGQFTEFRWQDPPFYTTFNGRFPRVLTTDNSQPVEGSLRYGMLSSGWNSIFRNDTLRIDVQIQDRALNRSNEVSSDEVTLDQIRQ